MKVLTFGWDYPPLKNGGLGVACYGLTQALIADGVDMIIVLPKTQPVMGGGRFIFADTERFLERKEVKGYSTYGNSQTLIEVLDAKGRRVPHARTLISEVHRYAHKAAQIASEESFDIIHAHDWSSYLAGVAAKVASGKPLVLHVHATSFDQAGGDNVDPEIFKIEKEAFAAADTIVAISHYVKDMVVEKHGADPRKVQVVHNEHDYRGKKQHPPTLTELKKQGKKIVLYHGRITIQKGVDYFVRAARRVVDVEPSVVFVISGWGDMTNQIIEQVGAMGLSQHVIFAGSLWDDDRDRMFQAADLVVMPSVSEPFGLVPLEALENGAPSLVSKQSGVREVMKHVLVVDFWDVEEMANKIIATLRYPAMRNQLINYGTLDLLKMSWRRASEKIRSTYDRLIQWGTT